MENLILTVEQVMQRHDRALIERREKQEAAVRAAEAITREFMRWHFEERDSISAEEIISIIFSEFEFVPQI